MILLRAVHGQHKQVPRKLTLEMLAKVAAIADYYECQEPIHIYKDFWLNALEERIPTTWSQNLISWIWVAWFFQLPAKFKESTSVAMSFSDNLISSMGLPIPDIVISM